MRRLVYAGLLAGVLSIGGCDPTAPPGDAGPDGEVGDPCIRTTDCGIGLSCVNRPGAAITPVCMADCDRTITRVCAEGSVCVMRTSGGGGICYLGGTTPVGGACTNTVQCEAGSVCVTDGGATSCFRACIVGDGSRCLAGEMCSALTSGDGYCAPTTP